MKKPFLKALLKGLTLVILVFASLHFADALAQGLGQGGAGLSIGGTGDVEISKDIVQDRTLGEAIIDIVNFFIGFLGLIATVMFVYAGVLWVIAGGNDEQITKAKKIMIYAGIGLIIVILSFSIVQFITSSAGGGGAVTECTTSEQCNEGEFCSAQGECKPGTGGTGDLCQEDSDCAIGFQCSNGICNIPAGSGCLSSVDCGIGQFCSASGVCLDGNSISCSDNSQCDSPKICDPFGFCVNPNAGSGTTCSDNSDCPTGYVCNGDGNVCEIQGTGGQQGGTTGGATQGASEEALNTIDQSVNELGKTLADIENDINALPSADKDAVLESIAGGNLADKMANINSLIDSSSDPAVIAVLEQLLAGLQRLQLVREQLDDLRAVMPESEETIAAWDETSGDLDELIDDPTSSIKLRRFENMYRSLKDLIRKFPIVQSRIKAAPAEGNVPFTVTFDGLDSVDPTGGTISDYKWSFLDNSGNLVSLGNAPVVVHEFTEPNTYSVRLQVSTSNTDASGYRLAMDGVSTVRVVARPPSSQVAFRINGVEVRDVHHVTLSEATAGVAFDPSITVPAIGRTIEEYEWFYGDTTSEVRTVPATVVHSYDQSGEYFVTLGVTDSQGIEDKRVVKLIVKSLAADIEFAPEEGNVNTEFRFRGINSRSDDGVIQSYEWKISDQSGQTVATSGQEGFYHTFDRPGKYNVELLVSDSTGAQDRAVRTLEVFSRKPVANFTSNIPTTNKPNTVEFSAAGSYDPDQGDLITYSWDFDGDGQFEIVDSKDALVTHTYRRVGDYQVNLQVQDSFGQRNQVEKTVSVDSVLAGEIVLDKRAVAVGEEITLRADSENAVAYLWEFGDGLTESTEDDTITHTYSEKGKYKVKLNFFDRDDNANSDTAYVLVGTGDGPIAVADFLVGGKKPIVVDDLCGAGKPGAIVTRSDNISLSGRESVNRDGTSRLLSYDWRFSDGSRNSNRDLTHRYDEVNRTGECFSVELVVRDEISGNVSDKDTLYFKVVNELPTIIDFVVQPETTEELVTPTKVSLKVVGPRDPDGQIRNYKWWYYREGFESQPLGVHKTSMPEAEMIITAQGQPGLSNRYYFGVEITDNDNGIFNSTERFGDVSYLDVENGPNVSPVAEFTVDKTTISVGDSITFISQSYDPQGDELPITAFQWDFDGDGAFDDTTSGPQVNRQYNTPGEYEARLKVVHRGLSSSTSRKVFVEPTNSFPQAAFTYTVEGNTVRFNGNASRYDPDLDDTTLRFEWDFDIQEDADGNGTNDDDVQSTEVSPTFTFSEAGLYRVRLLVKDSLGQEGVVVRDVNLNLTTAERERDTYHSLVVSAPEQPITTMDVSISPFRLSRGQTADISVVVQNADNSKYFGKVFFDLLDGTGEFTPNPVEAVDSRATAIFTAVDPGPVRLRITATETYYGDITEEIILNVR